MSRKKLPIINALDIKSGGSRVDESIYSRWLPNVKAEDDTEETITIYQTIGEDFWGEGFTARRMSAALRSIGKKDVTVSINSPGGDFFEGATIYNLLREHPGKVTVKIPGLAASAASVIAMAGDVIQISEIGFYMIHNAWGVVMGNRNEMRKTADTFETFDDAMVGLYAARSGFDSKKIAKMMDDDTWMNATDAIEKGFADEIMPAKAVEETVNKEKQAKAMARRTLEIVLAKHGLSRKDREDIFQKAFGTRDAAEPGERDAACSAEELEGLNNLLKTIKGV